MKRLTLFSLAALLIGAAQPAPKTRAAVEQTVRDYFAMVANNDLTGAMLLSTDDFTTIEEGSLWDNDSLFALIRPFFDQGGVLRYEFGDFTTTVRGNTAWTYYYSTGILDLQGEQTVVKFLESAVLIYRSGKWKMALLHSTDLVGFTSR